MKFYLAGPVGYDPKTAGWKSEIKRILREQGHEVYDPIENDHKYPKVTKMNLYKLKPRKHWREIREIMKPIFWDDCDYIKDCDYIICYFYGRALGTSSEQGIAHFLNLFSGKNIKTISIFDKTFNPDEWTIGCSDFVYFSIADFVKNLKKGGRNEALCFASRAHLQCAL